MCHLFERVTCITRLLFWCVDTCFPVLLFTCCDFPIIVLLYMSDLLCAWSPLQLHKKEYSCNWVPSCLVGWPSAQTLKVKHIIREGDCLQMAYLCLILLRYYYLRLVIRLLSTIFYLFALDIAVLICSVISSLVNLCTSYDIDYAKQQMYKLRNKQIKISLHVGDNIAVSDSYFRGIVDLCKSRLFRLKNIIIDLKLVFWEIISLRVIHVYVFHT